VAGACVAACTADAQCGAGKYCNQGACAVDTRPKPKCTADNECGGTGGNSQKCVEGYCKYACTADAQCRLIDARIGFCAKDLVCRTSSEASAECTGPGQCAGGKQCIDNACK